jgi:hypothetical protein
MKFWQSSTNSIMAGKVNKNDIDEKAIIASFASDEPTDYQSLIGENKESDNKPLPRAESTKEDTRRKRVKELDYESLFIQESTVTARTGKMVYIRNEFHDTLKAMCNVFANDGITLSGYIDNVLAHHIETYGDDMNRLHDGKYKGLNINKKQ